MNLEGYSTEEFLVLKEAISTYTVLKGHCHPLIGFHISAEWKSTHSILARNEHSSTYEDQKVAKLHLKFSTAAEAFQNVLKWICTNPPFMRKIQ